MTRKAINTPGGDRQRDRAARRRQSPAKPLEGNRIRVRTKRLDQVDPDKLALAYWLLAMRLVEDKTDPRSLSEENVATVAAELDGQSSSAETEAPSSAERSAGDAESRR
jgi:hypothetical protein